MADDLNDSSVLQSADALAEQSARAQRAQAEFKSRDSLTSPGASLKPNVNLDDEAGAGLDAALAEVVPENEQPITNPVNPVPAPKAPTPKKDDAPPEEAPVPDPDGGSALDNLLKDASADPTATPPKKDEVPPADPYAAHQLPANASAKSREHFDKLKQEAQVRENAATERAANAERQLTELQTKVAELEKKDGALPEAVEKELKELREHRAQFDTERDPEFNKKFESRIVSNYEGVYRELKKHGLPDTEVERLRAFGKQERDAAIEGLLSKLGDDDSSKLSKRLIEAKLTSNIGIEDERQEALAQARSNAEQSLRQRAEQPAIATKQRVDTIANLVAPQIKGLGWIFTKNIPTDTPPELRKRMEADNAFALKAQNDLRSAISNDDPETRATAALSVPLAQYFARENRVLKAQLAEAQGKLARISAAGATSRLADRATPQTKTPAPKASLEQENSGDAVDALFQESGGKL